MKIIVDKFGFTMIEILLSVALLSALASMSIPIFRAFRIRNDLAIVINTTAQSFHRAQILSQSMSHDDVWGVYVHDRNIVIFRGDDYASRDVDFDEVFNIPSSITTSGLSEVVFDKLTGTPQNVGSIIFSTNINENKTITINSKGMVDY